MLNSPKSKGIPSPVHPLNAGEGRSNGAIREKVEGTPPVVEQAHQFGWAYLRECIAASPHGNLCVALALIIGFYHGWLKRTFPGALAVFAYDIPLLFGLVFAVQSVPPKHPLFPGSRTSVALRAVLVLCVIFLLIPTDVPWLVRIASLRGWTFAPLMFLVGYHILKSSRLLWVFSVLIILLCVSVAIYGALQNPLDYINAKTDDEGFRKTIDGSTYARTGGGAGFRVFSSFVGPGMFATTMAFGILISVGQFTSSRIGMIERLFWAAGALFSFYGLFISGSRSPILFVIIGTAVILGLRQNLIRIVPSVIVVGIVVYLFSPALKAIDLSRLQTAFAPSEILWRVWIVIYPTILALLEFPLGRGLGHATHGVPVILFHLLARFRPGLIDGDLGHAAVDFGLVGMVVYLVMMIRAVQDSILWTKALRGTDAESIGILTAALMVITFPAFVVGSPFLHVPTGAIVWYYLGGLNRLYDDRLGDRTDQKKSGKVQTRQPFVGINSPEVGPVPPVLMKPVSAASGTHRPAKPHGAKRFLYR